MQILIVPFMAGLLGHSAVTSSYVKNHLRKQQNAKKGIVPVDKDSFGSISVDWVQSDNIYTATWKSKLTNSVTTLNKLGPDKFLVGRTAPDAEAVNFMFKDKEPAIKAFFYNTDLFRTRDSSADQARAWFAEHFKRAEGLVSLTFNPKKMLKAQRNFNKIIKVGRDRQHTAKLLGVDINGDYVRVRLFDEETNTYGKERKIHATRAWYD